MSTTRRCIGVLGLAFVTSVATWSIVSPDRASPIATARLFYRARLALDGADVVRGDRRLLQQAANDCSHSVVHALYRTTRLPPIDPTALSLRFPLEPRGLSLQSLRDGLASLGWSATIVRGRVGDPPPTPYIALLNARHYVLVLRSDSTRVEVFDPMVGTVRFSRARFRERWSGTGIQPLWPSG